VACHGEQTDAPKPAMRPLLRIESQRCGFGDPERWA
jgi:hypothetical protein